MSRSGANGLASLRFKLVRFVDVQLSTTAYYLIREVVPRSGVVLVYGPPKCGKSFLVFDIALHIALNRPYRGRRVTPGAVVYIALEGERGLGARIAAFKAAHGLDDADPNFYVIATRLDLVEDCNSLIQDIKVQINVEPAAIVIDTLNRSYRGDENSAQDMGAYVQAADAIRAAFSCCVLLIHHCGVDGSRPRGSSALAGAVEAQIAVKKDSSGLITAEVEYAKDGPSGVTINSRLEVLVVGTDDDGQPITSCVVRPADDEKPARTRPPDPKGRNGIALTALQRAVGELGKHPPLDLPDHVRAVSVETWRTYFYDSCPWEPGTTQDGKRKAFKRAVDDLVARKRVACRSDSCWPI